MLTSDNPRSEDPLAIINDALPGLQRSGHAYIPEPDRRKAIALALDEARAGDIVLIAGKGHEKKQTTARRRVAVRRCSRWRGRRWRGRIRSAGSARGSGDQER